tara:strand:- start:166 stop:480 length:315 start_codon:yes stop_codon:yes gene_type:complete
VAVFVEEILFFLRGCDFVVVVVILRVVVSCGVLTLWVCTERKGGSVFSQSKVSTRERERERESRETERKKFSKKKEQRAFGFLFFSVFFVSTNRRRSGHFQPRK